MVSKLGVKHEECIFIDDLESNVKGGEDAGIKALHVNNIFKPPLSVTRPS